MKRSTYLAAIAVVVGLAGVRTAGAQSFFDKLKGTPKAGANSVLVKPAVATSESSGVFLGLVGDDIGEGGQGVRVVSVRAKGPAEQAGVRPDDVIKSINQQAVGSLDEMAQALKGKQPGDKIAFQVDRKGKVQAILVTLGKKPDETPKAPSLSPPGENKSELPPRPSPPAEELLRPAAPSEKKLDGSPVLPPPAEQESDAAPVPPSLPPPMPPSLPAAPDVLPSPAAPQAALAAGKPSLGITVNDLTPESCAAFGLTVQAGALVTAVRANSSASLAGIPVGAAIVAFEGRPIKISDELVQEVRLAQAGQEVELTYYVGDRLQRAKVKLAGAEVAAAPPDKLQPAAPLPDGTPADPGPAARQPVLDRVERLIKGLGRAGEPTAPSATAGEAMNPAELPRLLETIRSQLEALQKRLDEQEERLQALEKPKP
ncbi:MAG: PDZ domain-containing protein [Planctomycetota bacterium]|nr:PDZ domain-containing protein [Planctomycetota bacterium]